MKEDVKDVNRSNTTLIKRKEKKRTVQRITNEHKESKKNGHNLMKELESHSSEVNRVKDKLVRVRSSKLNFFKKYRNLSKLNQRLKERIIKRN